MRRQLTTSLPRRARLVDASGREYEVPDALVATMRDDKVPPLLAILGAGGLVPYAFYAASIGGDEEQDGNNYGAQLLHWIKARTGIDLGLFEAADTFEARHHLLSYSACIVSFMAAIHWGAAMASPVYRPGMYLFSVVPPVLCWLSLNMSQLSMGAEGDGAGEGKAASTLKLGARLGTWDIPLVNAFVIHTACHVVTFVRDTDAIKASVMPQWYRKLRVPLAGGAVASLIAAMALIATTPEAAAEDAFLRKRYFKQPDVVYEEYARSQQGRDEGTSASR